MHADRVLAIYPESGVVTLVGDDAIDCGEDNFELPPTRQVCVDPPLQPKAQIYPSIFFTDMHVIFAVYYGTLDVLRGDLVLLGPPRA